MPAENFRVLCPFLSMYITCQKFEHIHSLPIKLKITERISFQKYFIDIIRKKYKLYSDYELYSNYKLYIMNIYEYI